ncbi:hypothetical protein ACFWM3_19120 [Gottfriedia sp. NPDC058432]|uniref:hypothetical protein n=1 Tax=Gottfriedia sp. NPDC058432 TaxID=3346497 RepID=UPI00365E39CA
MRYSNGFYLFQINQINSCEIESINYSHNWKFIKNVANFNCYTFSYLITSQMYVEFDEASVWIDEARRLLIVFTRDENILKYVFQGLNMKFHMNCIPFDLGLHSFLLKDGKNVITCKYNDTSSNKVITSLIRTDSERIKLIEKLLNGEINGILENCY